MAGTLLSGTNIVYNGNPLNDLSLTAFLDKFMEKKPKQSTWHGSSQIEPSKKLYMSNHMIGSEIQSLAEEDVAPEDLVFHKFYVNKMNSTKHTKKKKKKKLAEEEAAEELYDVDGGDGGNDEEAADFVVLGFLNFWVFSVGIRSEYIHELCILLGSNWSYNRYHEEEAILVC